MKRLTVESMIIDYLDAFALDMRSWKFHGILLSSQTEVYNAFQQMANLGYISQKTFERFEELTCHCNIDDSCMAITSDTGRVMYRFNEESGHFEKAC